LLSKFDGEPKSFAAFTFGFHPLLNISKFRCIYIFRKSATGTDTVRLPYSYAGKIDE